MQRCMARKLSHFYASCSSCAVRNAFTVALCGQSRHARTQRVAKKYTNKASRSDSQNDISGAEGFELPEALQGLTLSSDGEYLLDSKTGQIVNEFGATRFDVAVRALRGDFDPPKHVENTERNSSILLGAMKQFPLDYDFNVVYKGGPEHASFVKSVRAAVERVCGSDVQIRDCRVSERLSGKFVSIRVTARIGHPDLIAGVFAELDQDLQIVMKY